MGRVVRKLKFDDIYAIGRNESWFSDMAKNGLHLKKYGRMFVSFEKGEPKETKYRIAYMKEQPSTKQLDAYRERGWSLVTGNREFYVFSAGEEACSSELYPEPVEQGISLSELEKKLTWDSLFVLAAILFFIGMIFSVYFLDEEPYLNMVKGQFVQHILLILIYLYLLYSTIRNRTTICKLRKSLLQGKEIDHSQEYGKARLQGGILTAMLIPVLLCAVFIPFTQIYMSKEYTLPEASVRLPAVRLADIEQTDHYKNEIDGAYWVRYNWSLLAPVKYEIVEKGIVDGKYSPSITTRFYRLTFSGMADKLTLDLISHYIYVKDTDIRTFSVPGPDKVYIAEENSRKQIFAYSGNKVIHVSYRGKAEIERIIPLVTEKLLSYRE